MLLGGIFVALCPGKQLLFLNLYYFLRRLSSQVPVLLADQPVDRTLRRLSEAIQVWAAFRL
jgi:hypothetical protein